jgi:ABC-type transport system involved in multi-copper enzyme maturation permease subunit
MRFKEVSMKIIIGLQLWAIALNVWRQAVHDRILALLTASGVLLMLFSLVLSAMTVGDQSRVVQNSTFWIMGTWGLLAVLYLGSNIITQEIQRKTSYMVLYRPVVRPTFLMGKFFGMCIVLVSIYILLSIGWLGLMILMAIPLSLTHLWVMLFILLEWILLAGFSVFFASFTSSILHNFFLVGITFLGHWCNDLLLFAQNAQVIWVKNILKSVYFVLPNLEALNFREAVLYDEAIGSAILVQGAFVAIGWMLTALIAANIIFTARKLI